MRFVERKGIRFLVSETLERHGVIHGFSCRQGGVSSPPWNAMNLSTSTGDDPETVRRNHQLLLAAFDRDLSSLYDVWQVHGRRVIFAQQPRGNLAHEKADAIITDDPGITLLMRFGDCVPILLYDPVKQTGGIAHAGWQGTVKKVAAAAVEAMVTTFSSKPEDILAVIGPSIGPDDYEVGEEVVRAASASYAANAAQVIHQRNGSCYFDLWLANELCLRDAGVKHVEQSRISTSQNIKDWYSHRGENGKTGRFGAVLILPETGINQHDKR